MGTFSSNAFGGGDAGYIKGNFRLGSIVRQGKSRNAVERDPSLGINNSSFYGKPIPTFWGTVRLDGILLWASKAQVRYDVTETYGRYASVKIGTKYRKKRTVLEGTTQKEVSRVLSVAYGFGYTGRPTAAATAARITRLWADGELIYDVTGYNSIVSKMGLSFRFYSGSSTQPADPEIVLDLGAANTPAFRGLIYVVISGLDITPYGGVAPSISAEITQNDEITHTVKVMTTVEAEDDDTDLTTSSLYFVNERRQRAYLLSESVAGASDYALLRVFDIANMQSVGAYPLVSTLNQAPQMQIGGYLPKVNWIGLCENLSNTSKLVFFHAETGQLVATYGANSSALASPQLGAPGLTSMIELPGGYQVPPLYPDIDYTTPYSWTGSNPNYGPFKDGIIVVLGVQGKITILTRVANNLYFRNYYQIGEGGFNEDRPSNLIPGPANNDTWKDPGFRGQPLLFALFPYRDFIVSRGSKIYYGAVTLQGTGYGFVSNWHSFQTGKYPEGATEIYDAGSGVQICWIKLIYLLANQSLYGTSIKTTTAQLCFMEYDSNTDTYRYKRYRIAAGAMGESYYRSYGPGELFDLAVNVTIPNANVATVATMRRFVNSPHVALKDPYFVGWVSGDVWTYLNLINGDVVSRDTGSDTFVTDSDVTLTGPITTPTTGYLNSEDLSLTYVGPSAPADAPFIGKVYLDRAQFPNYLIRTLLRELCLKAGYDTGDIVTSNNITETVYGCILNERVNLMDLLSNICALYSISMVESEGKIKFSKNLRGTSFSYNAEIPYDDLASGEGSEDTVYINSERGGKADLPGKLEVKYIDRDADYAVGIQYSQRITYPVATSNASQTVVTLSVPLVMTASDAAQIASKVLFEAWAGQTFHSVRTSYQYLKLEPGDFVKLTREDGDDYVCRVESMSLNGDRSISLGLNTLSIDDDYTPPTISSPRPVQELSIPAFVDLQIVDNIMLDNTTASWETIPQVNWMASYYSTSLEYVDLVVKASSISEEDQIAGTYENPPIFGFLTSDLADTDTPFQILYDATITVRLIEAVGFTTPASAADHEDFLSGSYGLLVGTEGRWELIYYKTATDNGDGTYTFITLIRARNGSELWTGDHIKGDKVFLLNDEVVPLSLRAEDIGTAKQFVAVGSGTSVDLYEPELYLNEGDTLLPLAPWNVRADRVSTDTVITWDRRSRIAHVIVDGTGDVPLNEASEAYEIDILDLNTGAVVRTVTGITSETYSYSDANATTDGYTTPPTRVRLKVYQISAVVGRGRTRDLTVDVE